MKKPPLKWTRLGKSQHYVSSMGDVKKVGADWFFYSVNTLEWGPYSTKEEAFAQADRSNQ